MTSSSLERSSRDGPLVDLGVALLGAIVGVALTIVIGSVLTDDAGERVFVGAEPTASELRVADASFTDPQALNRLYLAAVERLSDSERGVLPPSSLSAMFDAAEARATTTRHSALPDPEVDTLFRMYM